MAASWIELYPNVAPKMVERFKKLINEHFYDGKPVHRVDPGLGIIQGGDPLTKGNTQLCTARVTRLILMCRRSSATFLRARNTGRGAHQRYNGANCQCSSP